MATVLALASATTASAAPPSGQRDYTVAPAPAWVEHLTASSSVHLQAEPEAGVVDLLSDDQLHVDRQVEHYIHRIKKITSLAGLERGAEIAMVVDPSYERFVLHGLHVVRGDQRIDGLSAATVRAFDTEEGREQHIYDGSRRIVFLLSDVRVGDVIDFEATTIGLNPVFKGRVARWIALGSSRPALRRRVRVLAAASRSLAFRLVHTDVPVTTRPLGTATETFWDHDLPAFASDGGEPAWYDGRPALAFSEFSSWADVARWAADLYRAADPPSPRLQSRIREIAAAHATDEARALAALRFVQDDVRYLGVELGEHSYRPHSASVVFDQRFGDCKDKVLLLLTMLHGLGLEAHAALVNTDLDARVAQELPRPQTFDHAIARLHIGGRYIWVDATRALERGPLGAAPVTHARALVASPETSDLSVIDSAPLSTPQTTVKEIFRLKGDAAVLDVTTTYRGASADSVRYRLGHTTRSETRASYLEFYTKQFSTIEAVGELGVEDDEANDVVVVREAYRLPVAVKGGHLALWAHALASTAAAPSVTRRTSPLAVPSPLFVRHEIEVETDGDEVALPEHVNASDAALTFTMQAERRPHGIRVVFELQSRADSVPLAEVPGHLEVLQKIRRGIDQELPIAPPSPVAKDAKERKAEEHQKEMIALAGTAGFLALTLLVVFAPRAVRRARRWRWVRRVTPDTGQTPGTAIRVRSRADGERHVLARRWSCDHARPEVSAVVWSTASLGGRELSAARASCPSCAESHVCYFVLEGSAQDDSPLRDAS